MNGRWSCRSSLFFSPELSFILPDLLTGLRQARWYASRGLGLGAAFIVSITIANVPEFWRALVFILAGGAVLATAAWGSFMSNGYYEGQPALGRRALVGSLMLGCLVVVGLAVVLLESLLRPHEVLPLVALSNDQGWRDLQNDPTGRQTVGNHGTQWRAAERYEDRPSHHADRFQSACGFGIRRPSRFRRPSTILKAVIMAATRQISITSAYGGKPPTPFGIGTGTGGYGAIDIASRRFIGSLGPSGFAPGLATGPARFSRPEGQYGNGYYNSSYPARTLMTDTRRL